MIKMLERESSIQINCIITIHNLFEIITPYYKELLSEKWLDRNVEKDAIDGDAEEEKHFG